MYFSIHANVFGRSHYLKLVVASLILFHGFISHLNMEKADWLNLNHPAAVPGSNKSNQFFKSVVSWTALFPASYFTR